MSDVNALFGSSAVSRNDDAKEESATKRLRLFRWEHASAQSLQPFGKTPMCDLDNKVLWTAVSKGSKKIGSFSNFVGGQDRQTIAISQTAQVMTLACEKLMGDPTYTKLFNSQFFDVVKKEIAELLPHFKNLNHGPTPQVASLAYANAEPSNKVGKDAMIVSAKRVHSFLTSEASPLRGLLQMLCGSGLFFSAFTADKVARAFVQEEKITSASFMEAATARVLESTPASSVCSDTNALFGSA
jgi:hypothetical protein